MINNDISVKHNKVDYLLAVTAVAQSFFGLLQLFFIDSYIMSIEDANRFRVLATALPILFSMFFVMKRKPTSVIITYIIAGIILLLTTTIYPSRWAYMNSEVLKFTLPILLPTGLCVASIQNYLVLRRGMLITALATSVIALLYMVMYFRGLIFVEGYSMGFSYSLLLPVVILYMENKKVYKVLALVMTMEMLALGSRGAFIVAIFCFFVDYTLRGTNKIRNFTILALFALVLSTAMNPIMIALSGLFESIGIHSRTLTLMASGELLSHDSGRSIIQAIVWQSVDDNPIFGQGIFADREILNGAYCHNLILELLCDFGYFGTGLLMIILLSFLKKVYRVSEGELAKFYTLIFLGSICGMWASGSFLVNYNVGLVVGLGSFLIKYNFYRQSEIL